MASPAHSELSPPLLPWPGRTEYPPQVWLKKGEKKTEFPTQQPNLGYLPLGSNEFEMIRKQLGWVLISSNAMYLEHESTLAQ